MHPKETCHTSPSAFLNFKLTLTEHSCHTKSSAQLVSGGFLRTVVTSGMAVVSLLRLPITMPIIRPIILPSVLPIIVSITKPIILFYIRAAARQVLS